jgi:DNA-binding IclR family transcriptional regulator
MALSCYSGPDGVFQSPRKTLARVIGMNVMTVSRAVKDLERLGAIVIDGDLRTKLGWFSHRWEWNERPTITLIPELRSTDRPE